MKHFAVDLKTGTAHLFSCRTELCRLIGVTTQTSRNWQKQAKTKEYKGYLIGFNVQRHKNERMTRFRGVQKDIFI